MKRIWLVIALLGGLILGGTQMLLGQAQDLENEIAAGNEVSFPIKYRALKDDSIADGVLRLSKSTFAFDGRCRINRGFGHSELCDFKVSPDNIIQLLNERYGPSSGIFLTVAIADEKGNKGKRRNYLFYNAGAVDAGNPLVSCNGCDDSMDTLYGLLTNFRNRNWPAASTLPASSAIAPEPPPPPPPVAPLKLPSVYANAQAPADKLQLNADSSFSLEEGGEVYHGKFVTVANTLELTIAETNTKTTLTRQGSDLADGNGQTWNYSGEPTVAVPAPTVLAPKAPAPKAPAPSAAVLRNADIIKLVKVGIDDGTVIAKIRGSKCRFDMSVDALLLLKKSGVSAAVLKAMAGAGQR